LPLTAIATPPPRKRGIGLLSWCIILGGGFWIIAYASDQHNNAVRAAQQAKEAAAIKAATPAFMADIRSGKLDAYQFQKLCGQPNMRVNRKDFFSLMYTDRNLVVLFRHRKPDTTKAEMARAHPYAMYDDATFWEIQPQHMMAPEAALQALECKAAQ
jgi:hypothetical protein